MNVEREQGSLEHVEFPTKRWFEWPPPITPWLQSDGWLLVILRYIFGPWAFSTIGRDKLPVSERVKLSACSSLATEPSCLLSRHHAGNDNTYQSYVTKYILLLNLNQSFQSWCVFLQSRAFKYWQCIMTKVASLFLLQILGSFIQYRVAASIVEISEPMGLCFIVVNFRCPPGLPAFTFSKC